jgi:hypothetical protein
MTMATATRGSTSPSTWLKRIIFVILLVTVISNPLQAATSTRNIVLWFKDTSVSVGQWVGGRFAQ